MVSRRASSYSSAVSETVLVQAFWPHSHTYASKSAENLRRAASSSLRPRCTAWFHAAQLCRTSRRSSAVAIPHPLLVRRATPTVGVERSGSPARGLRAAHRAGPCSWGLRYATDTDTGGIGSSVLSVAQPPRA